MMRSFKCRACGTEFKPNRPTRIYCSSQCYFTGKALSRDERFLQKVKPVGPDTCWLWTGAKARSGYGNFVMITKKYAETYEMAHRYAWIRANGPIPEGLHVLHKCDVKLCVNPSHLFLGTAADNMADKVAKGRQPRGSMCKISKLTEADVIEIRRNAMAWQPRGWFTRMGEHYGVDSETISNVVNRKLWKHVP
jgi:hypothetical protein